MLATAAAGSLTICGRDWATTDSTLSVPQSDYCVLHPELVPRRHIVVTTQPVGQTSGGRSSSCDLLHGEYLDGL